MTREQCLACTMAEVVEHVKGLHKLLSTVMLDVAAVRQTVLTEASQLEIYSARLKAGAQIAKPLLETAMRSYDEIIEKLEAIAAHENSGPETQVPGVLLQ